MAATRTILLIEDDPNDVLLIQRALRKNSIPIEQVRVVTDGDQASRYLSGADPYGERDRYPVPALILLDLKLPCRSGFEVLSWLRSVPEYKYLPVIILTSSKHSQDMKRAYQLGANSYLLKPVDFDFLSGMMNTVTSYWLEMNQRPDLTEGP